MRAVANLIGVGVANLTGIGIAKLTGRAVAKLAGVAVANVAGVAVANLAGVAVAKLTGVALAKLNRVAVAAGDKQCMTAEQLPVSSSARGDFSVCPAAATASSGEEMKLVSSQSEKPCLEIDDCVYTFADEKVIMGGAEPIPRDVFGGAPTLQEAREATSELAVSIEKVYLSSHDSVGYGSSLSNSQVERAKACVIGEMEPVVPSQAVKAFRLLHESSEAQNVVASLARDPNVWTAVQQNRELQEFLHSQKTNSVTSADHLMLSAKTIESELGNGFVDFVKNIKVTLVDMMNNLSESFQNFFGGKWAKVFANGVGTPRLSAENVMETSFLGLAIMAIMVILLKRG